MVVTNKKARRSSGAAEGAPASSRGRIKHASAASRSQTAVPPKRHRASDPDDFKTSMLSIRIKDELKTEATRTLEQIGISLPEAVRVFLGRIVREQAFPFPLEVPNAETAAALRDSMAADPARYTTLEAMLDDLQKGDPQ